MSCRNDLHPGTSDIVNLDNFCLQRNHLINLTNCGAESRLNLSSLFSSYANSDLPENSAANVVGKIPSSKLEISTTSEGANAANNDNVAMERHISGTSLDENSTLPTTMKMTRNSNTDIDMTQPKQVYSHEHTSTKRNALKFEKLKGANQSQGINGRSIRSVLITKSPFCYRRNSV